MSGKTDQVKGRAKEAAGTLTGSKKLASEGRADRRGGEVKQTLERQGQVTGFIDKAEDNCEKAIDKIKGTRNTK
jgi:uncharacterized protein YjbJ (UPF0337 family)